MQKGTIVFTALSLFALSGCAKVFVDETGCGGSGGSSANTPSSSSSSGVPLCSADADCEDGFACTANVCGNGACSLGVVAGCKSCDADADCDDGNPCTHDRCIQSAHWCANAISMNGIECDTPSFSGGSCFNGTCCPQGTCLTGLLCMPC